MELSRDYAGVTTMGKGRIASSCLCNIQPRGEYGTSAQWELAIREAESNGTHRWQSRDGRGLVPMMSLGTKQEHATAWVCVDCYTAHAGITEQERGEPFPDGVLSLFGPGEEITAGLVSEEHDTPCGSFDEDGTYLGGECECEEISFSWRICDGCGSPLGGSRHALTVVWWE